MKPKHFKAGALSVSNSSGSFIHESECDADSYAEAHLIGIEVGAAQIEMPQSDNQVGLIDIIANLLNERM